MRALIRWSGERSRLVTDLFKHGLGSQIKTHGPRGTIQDIENGTAWLSDKSAKSNDAALGTVYIMKESTIFLWVLFEVGVLAKGLPCGSTYAFLVDCTLADEMYE